MSIIIHEHIKMILQVYFVKNLRKIKLVKYFKDQHGKVFEMISEHRPRKTRSSRKKKRSSQHNGSFETVTTGTTATNSEGRHFHLDMNTVPFILGASTSPSHNVKSNVQNVTNYLNKNKKIFFFLI
jgi:hypothetical protein